MRALYPTGVNSEFGVVANKPVVTTIVSDTTTTTTTTGTVTTDGSGTTITTTGGGSVVIGTDNSLTVNGTPTTGTVVTDGGGVTTITTTTGTVITVTPVDGGGVIVDTSTPGHTETPITEVTPEANLPVTVAKFASSSNCRVELIGLGLGTIYCTYVPGVTGVLNVQWGTSAFTQGVNSVGSIYDYSVSVPSLTHSGSGLKFILGKEQVTVSFNYLSATNEIEVTLVGCKFISKTFNAQSNTTTIHTNTTSTGIVNAVGVLTSVTSIDNTPIVVGDPTPNTPPIIGDNGGTPITTPDLDEILTALGITFTPKSLLLTNKPSITDDLIVVGEPTDPIVNPTDPPTPVPPVEPNEVKAPWTMYFPVQVGGFVFALNSYDTGTETTGAMQLVKFDATTFAFISQVRISKRRIHWLSAHDGYIYSIGVSDIATNPTSNIQSFCKFDTDLNLVESIDIAYSAIPPFKWAQTTDGIWTSNRNLGLSNVPYNIGGHYASEIATPNIYSWVITDGTSLWYWGSSTVARFDISSNTTVNMNLTLVDGVVVGNYIYGITPTSGSVIPRFERWNKYSGARDGSFGYDMKNESFSNGYHQVHTDGRYIVFGAADIQVYDTVSNSIVYARPRNTYHQSMAAHFMAPGKLVIAVTDISYDQRNVIARYSLVVTL